MTASLSTQADRAEAKARIAAAGARAAVAEYLTASLESGGGRRREPSATPVSLPGSYRKTISRVERRAKPPTGSASAHRDSRTRADKRRECQDALRNNPLVAAMVHRKAQLVLGDGPRFTSHCPDPDFKRDAERLMDEWANGTGQRSALGAASLCGRFTLTDIIAQAITAGHTDGRLLTLLTEERGGSFVRPALQVIEDERVVNPGHKSDSRLLRNGVELSETGRPVAYHIGDYDEHGTYVRADKTERREASGVIDWSAPGVHMPNLVAPEPLLTVVLDQTDQWDEAMDATVNAYRLATLFGGVVTGGSDPMAMARGFAAAANAFPDDPDVAAAISGSRSSNDGSGTLTPIQPGMLHFMGEGRVEQLKPEHPATGLRDFDRLLVGKMAAALDLSVDAVTYDYDGNWSASRARLTMVWRALSVWRQWMLRRLHTIARWRLAWAIDHGELKAASGWDSMTWRIAEMPVLDPEKEVKAALDAVGGMLKSRSQVLSSMGLPEIEEVARQLGDEQRLFEANGIKPEARQGAGVVGSSAGGPAGPKATGDQDAPETEQESSEATRARGSVA